MPQHEGGTFPAPVLAPPLLIRAAGAARLDVSVCIVNWNCCELLRGAVRSLLDQPQGTSLEVIVVDNASSDGAPDMLAREFPEVRLIRNRTNAGFARANNQAARTARGRYLFFLNNDTVVPAQTLARLTAYLRAHPDAVLAAPRLRDADGKVQISWRRQPTIATFLHRTLVLRWTGLFRAAYRAYRRQDAAAPGSAKAVDVVMGAAVFVRRDEFLTLGAWDESFTFGGEDLELCHRANRRGRVVYLPDVEITHFGRVSTRRNIAFASTQIAVGFIRYFRKTGAGRIALVTYKLALTLDAPLQLCVRGVQYLLRRWWGRAESAQQSLIAFRGALAFLRRGWWQVWRA